MEAVLGLKRIKQQRLICITAQIVRLHMDPLSCVNAVEAISKQMEVLLGSEIQLDL